MDNTTIKAESIELKNVIMNLKDFKRLNYEIDFANLADGPSVNISAPESGANGESYTVTVLTYLPDAKLQDVENTSGLKLEEDKVYLNYYGINPVKVLNKQGKYETVQGREFRVEFKYEGEKDSVKYQLCYLQFSYTVTNDEFADYIWVRDENEDPETDRGTISTPATAG